MTREELIELEGKIETNKFVQTLHEIIGLYGGCLFVFTIGIIHAVAIGIQAGIMAASACWMNMLIAWRDYAKGKLYEEEKLAYLNSFGGVSVNDDGAVEWPSTKPESKSSHISEEEDFFTGSGSKTGTERSRPSDNISNIKSKSAVRAV